MSNSLDRYVIHGGRPLHGEIEISGAKNAAVAIIPAALMVDGVCRIENMPQISDVDMLLKILQGLGARVEYLSPSAVEIDCTQVRFTEPPYDLMRKIRASYYFIGSMLSRFGSAKTTMPGGCNFGVRPIDQHIKGMTAMGANVEVKNGFVYADTPDGRLHGAKVYLDKVSVGATMNIIIAATLARGRTVIENAAREPHIVDLANFLNSMGADIRGAGTDSIRIQGVERLHGGTYSVIPDQIEAGTYMAACAAAGAIWSASAPSCARWASPSSRAGTACSCAATAACAIRTSRPSRTPASRRICSRRSAWRCVWPTARAS